MDEEQIKKEIEEFTKRYKNQNLGVKTDDFQDFENEILPSHYSFYEKSCNFCAKIISFKVDEKKRKEIEEALETCHLKTTPEGVNSFAVLVPLSFVLISILLTFLINGLLFNGEGIVFFIMVWLFFGFISIIPLMNLPFIMANSWRLKASNQMVMSIFYIVSFMRHTSNLELAIKFTSDHLQPPLSIDFKKIIWNLETGKFHSLKDSLDNYLERWKKYNMEFVESMHLIEASLYEPSEKKRLESLEKAMSVMLESTYEKMLHFAQELKSPITTLHMLGVILPILGLVILPLVVGFLGGVEWYHIAILYNLFLPLLVWYFGKIILSTRPSGYGQADITEVNEELKKYAYLNIKFFNKEYRVNPLWISLGITGFFVFIAFLPLVIYGINNLSGSYWDIGLTNDYDFEIITSMDKVKEYSFTFLGYKENSQGKIIGPYGIFSTLLSILLPLGLTLGLSFYYLTYTRKLIEIRNKTRELENEFAAALFQLGNRVGDGLPAEIAFYKVSQITQNTNAGKFFELVYNNISNLGMGVEDAIFDKKYGAINKFPSALIQSSMKVFVESAKKGPLIASEALINISNYVKEMHKVEERLKDLMSEITSSMKSQISFLAPLIAGVVIGLTSMITTILNKLSAQMDILTREAGGAANAQQFGSMLDLFRDSIPSFYFQVVIGIYIIQVTYLLTTMLNTIENGYDPLNEKYLLGVYFKKSGLLYCLIAFFVILVFNLIAATVLQNTNLVGNI
ncbi:MAG: hypothetical protein QW757_05685 [Candidatus Woesearchaeota archaeon]